MIPYEICLDIKVIKEDMNLVMLGTLVKKIFEIFTSCNI